MTNIRVFDHVARRLFEERFPAFVERVVSDAEIASGHHPAEKPEALFLSWLLSRRFQGHDND